MALSPKQRFFAQEYLLDFNATRAAIRAGFSPATARSQGHRLLTKLDIRKFLQAEMAARAERLKVSADSIYREISSIAFANIADYLAVENGEIRVELGNMTREQAAGIGNIRIRDRGDVQQIDFKLSDKLKALVTLAKCLGMFEPALVCSTCEGHLAQPAHSRPRQK